MSELAEQQQAEEDAIAAQMGDESDDAVTGDVDETSGDVDEPELEADDDDQDDDDDQADDDTELHADEIAVQNEVDAEKTLKKVSQTGDRYIKRMLELLGPDLGGYQVCANCDGYAPGLVIPELVDDERRNAVKRQLGLETFDQLEADESRFRQCEVCKGRGRVKTGSVKAGQEAQDCGACGGHGFRSVKTPATPSDEQHAGAGGEVVELLVPELGNDAPTDLPPFDNFGTPSWHEDYGKQPDFRTVPVSHWAGNLPQST